MIYLFTWLFNYLCAMFSFSLFNNAFIYLITISMYPSFKYLICNMIIILHFHFIMKLGVECHVVCTLYSIFTVCSVIFHLHVMFTAHRGICQCMDCHITVAEQQQPAALTNTHSHHKLGPKLTSFLLLGCRWN